PVQARTCGQAACSFRAFFDDLPACALQAASRTRTALRRAQRFWVLNSRRETNLNINKSRCFLGSRCVWRVRSRASRTRFPGPGLGLAALATALGKATASAEAAVA